ncbi:MAG: AhpC/TSA family protein [Nostoc sp.]|uniref:AhpC/TSA family protein n=1 Tax=Nostoc sp. TaxID=1180 RepID=UPI002FF76EB8
MEQNQQVIISIKRTLGTIDGQIINYLHSRPFGLGNLPEIVMLTLLEYWSPFENKTVVQRCREIISEWLKGIGLQLNPEKTRLTHTFLPELSEDGKAGFDFLGHHIQQYPAGKYRSNRNAHGKILGFNTLITPSAKASKAHIEEIGRILRNMTEVLSNWNIYVPDSSYLTQRGGTFLFDSQGQLIYEHRDRGILSFAENMSNPLSFLYK